MKTLWPFVNTPEGWDARAEILDPAEAVGWSRRGQQERFDAVLAALDPKPGDSLLDFGCGTGAFADRLPDGVLYTGHDWSPAMIDRCRFERPDKQSKLGAAPLFLKMYPLAYYDYVACIGTFNIPGSKAETLRILKDVWDNNCRRKMAVSLYDGDDPACLSYTVDDAMSIAALLWADYEILYPRHNDLLLVLSRIVS